MQVLRRGAQKSLLHRRIDNNVQMSVQLIGCTWCKVLISRDKGCFAGWIGKRGDSIFMGRSGSTSLVVSCIVVPYGFGCSTALVFDRKKKKKKNVYCIKVLGKVIDTEKGYVIYTIFKNNNIC